jgi:signal transduction histidine kinase
MDWAILVVSLSNTILLFWLGLMVLLNTERRTWGVYLSGGAMLLGGIFFFSHTAIVGYSPTLENPNLETWWQAGWIPITCLPFAWYAVMLWYSGYWEPDSALRQRHRPWLWLAGAWAAVFLALLAFTHPLPSIAQAARFDFSASPAVYGLPVLILLYPLYTVLCTGLTLDVLRWPGPSRRALAEQARQRAWPWLGAASLALFLVGLLVGGTVFWVVSAGRAAQGEAELRWAVGILDLLIAALIGLAVILTGQAMVAYEVFTGKSLPRGGLRKAWRRALILACAYSPLASLAIVSQVPPVSLLLAATLLATVFYAWMSWRSFAEREHLMNSLRPFLASQELYPELISQEDEVAAPGATRAHSAFAALCDEVLETELAFLVPLGALQPLAGPPLAYPPHQLSPGQIPLPAETHTPAGAALLPLDPQRSRGAAWAIPLYARQSLIGVLLLGEKRSRGLYTQEEVEMARLAGERLLDAQASAEIARRLMRLQRQRAAESQVLDRQARRALHDEVLPELHAALLSLETAQGQVDRQALAESLAQAHRQIAALLRELPPAPDPQLARLGLAEALRQMVEQEQGGAFDQVQVEIPPAVQAQMASLPALACEVVYYAAREAVRNAARYGRGGIPERALRLWLRARWESGLALAVEDDGVGLLEAQASGGGSGQGLALHSTLLLVLGGTLAADPRPEGGTVVTIRL